MSLTAMMASSHVRTANTTWSLPVTASHVVLNVRWSGVATARDLAVDGQINGWNTLGGIANQLNNDKLVDEL